ncbi:MAG: hypothetical protein AAFY31_01945 [Pseudomonadota bacterium]
MMRILAITSLLVLAGYVMNTGGLPQTGSSKPGIGSVGTYAGAAKRAIGGLTGD